MVAQELAVSFPNRVARLALVCTSPGGSAAWYPLRRHRAGRQRRAIAQRVAGARLQVYEGGHAFFVQDAAALPDILDFLAG